MRAARGDESALGTMCDHWGDAVHALVVRILRHESDVEALVEAVVDATSLPVIAAGSVDSAERIRALEERGVWAFTIGTAALDGVLLPGEPLEAQIRYALAAISPAISP